MTTLLLPVLAAVFIGLAFAIVDDRQRHTRPPHTDT